MSSRGGEGGLPRRVPRLPVAVSVDAEEQQECQQLDPGDHHVASW